MYHVQTNQMDNTVLKQYIYDVSDVAQKVCSDNSVSISVPNTLIPGRPDFH